MSLFTLLEGLSSEQKRQLYEDTSVCLCLYRVAFSEVEQQILMRLCLMDGVAQGGEDQAMTEDNDTVTSPNPHRCVFKVQKSKYETRLE